jgi:hypothetical protein
VWAGAGRRTSAHRRHKGRRAVPLPVYTCFVLDKDHVRVLTSIRGFSGSLRRACQAFVQPSSVFRQHESRLCSPWVQCLFAIKPVAGTSAAKQSPRVSPTPARHLPSSSAVRKRASHQLASHPVGFAHAGSRAGPGKKECMLQASTASSSSSRVHNRQRADPGWE